jgi:predicted phosphoribosyltransferase
MPRFKVLCRVDAFVDYTTEIDATTAEEAAEIAYRNDQNWTFEGVQEFDGRLVVTLDADGVEIGSTARGDF